MAFCRPYKSSKYNNNLLFCQIKGGISGVRFDQMSIFVIAKQNRIEKQKLIYL